VIYIFFDRLGKRLRSYKSSLVTLDAEGRL